MDFNLFVKDITENSWNVHGAEVYKQGQLLHSYGDTNDRRYPIYSATKSVLSLAVGMAVDEGKFDIARSILNYMKPEWKAGLSEEQREIYEKLPVERFLTMSVKGFPFRPEGEHWIPEMLSLPLAEPGKREFDYSNVSAYLVGVALTNALQEDLYDYLNRKLFTPLEINAPTYGRCPDGYFYGASQMELTVNELSRIGLLVYNNGIYNGQRIVSEEYVKRATSVQQMCREGGYGYFFWKYRDGFSINGKWKQKCYILPKQELMITYLSDIRDDSHELLQSMEKHILAI